MYCDDVMFCIQASCFHTKHKTTVSQSFFCLFLIHHFIPGCQILKFIPKELCFLKKPLYQPIAEVLDLDEEGEVGEEPEQEALEEDGEKVG